MGYIPSRLDEPINLTPIHGDTFQVKDFVVLPIELDGTTFPITFLVMEICTSTILLGLDVLVQLESKTDYSDQTLTVVVDDTRVCTQLYTKDDLEEFIAEEEPAFKLTETTLDQYFEKAQPDISPEEKNQLVHLLLENKDLFATDFSDIPGIKNSDYHLELEDVTSKPVKSKLKRYSKEERDTIKNEIDTMLASNIIEPAFAPWCSPIKMVPKKDGTLRFCVNYFKLNSLTKKDTYPLPRIDDLVDMMAGRTFISMANTYCGEFKGLYNIHLPIWYIPI